MTAQTVGRRRIRLWAYDPEALTLTHRGPHYEIDLEEINSSAEMLDWIFQVASKQWADARTLAELVWALDEIFDPQSTLCSGGRDRGPIKVKEVIRRVRRRREGARSAPARSSRPS